MTYEKLGAIENDLAMIKPRLTGADANGNPFVITADAAIQDANNPKRARLKNLEADLALDNHGWLNATAGGGSVTGFYTVLTEGDDPQDPIADAARAILDGHIVLSRRLAEAGHYPAIDVEASISRVMPAVTSAHQLEAARRFKSIFSRYQRNRDLISVGAYVAGADPALDKAIAAFPRMEDFLQQPMDQPSSLQEAAQRIDALLQSIPTGSE